MTSPPAPGERPRQATVHRFDTADGSGAVITDDGAVLPFSGEAWGRGPLLSLRVGQRVAISVGDPVDGQAASSGDQRTVTAITLVTFPH